MLDTKEAAGYLGLAAITLQIWRSQGRGPRYVRMGRAIRYRMADLDTWVDQQTREPEPPRRRRSA
jgi:predicted DNA-binding transcriptional regulator AlpA